MKNFFISFLAFSLVLSLFCGTADPAFAEGSAPIAENLEIKTYRNTSVSGTMSAYDPEGDVVSFEISTKPVKGNISLEPNGSFIYTPYEGKKGRDYFGYKAVDSQGNYSQEATAVIRIEKQKKGVEYSDMENRAGEYAASVLSAKEIFTAEKIGDKYCFNPDKPVSRGEFVEMCASITGKEKNENMGDDLLSEAEAQQILNEMMELNDVEYIETNLEIDRAEMQACMNLNSVGIIDTISQGDNQLDREKAALMLVKAMEIIENR